MNRFDKMMLAAAVVVTLIFARGQMEIARLYIQMDHLSDRIIPTWTAGWLIATYGPIAVAAWFWRRAKRARAPWVLHILFLPGAIILLNAGESIMLSTIPDPDFDATLGGPMMPAVLLFLIAVGGYACALVSRRIRSAGDRAQGR
ncbi:MAG TPA: hypothetical protein VFW19_13795 [Allosphingosinicella sp.]|nr:hypothetical protein [Allosphingosinicella sp.]